MSLFRRFRGSSPDPDDAPSERPSLSPRLIEVGRAKGPAPSVDPPSPPRLVRGAAVEALSWALRHLRTTAPSHHEEVAAIDDRAGRAMLEEDYREVVEQLRHLRFDPIRAATTVASGIDVFHRVVFGARPLAGAMSLRGVEADLDDLLLTATIEHTEDRALIRLLRVLETFTIQAARTHDGVAIMKGCVAELIDALARLASEGEEEQASLSAIRERLAEAEDREDLEQLRERLIHCASALVEVASQREEVVRDAFTRASESQRRAQELEAALTDAEAAARTDVLTGLPNRRGLDEMVDRAAERGIPHAVLVLDLDHFKRVNDEHGHAIGDAVLGHVASLLRGELRGDDRAFRIGGEEIVVLLPEASWQGARATAERLRARLARVAIPIGQAREIRVTISIGIAVWEPPAPFATALEVADQALYRAKEGGRNRVVG